MLRKLFILLLFITIFILNACKQNHGDVFGILLDSNTSVIDEKVVFTKDSSLISTHQPIIK